MSTATGHQANGHEGPGPHPRAAKLPNPKVSRALTDVGVFSAPHGASGRMDSRGSSGRSTPLPVDAPPSTQSISSARKQVRAQNKQRLFPSIEYTARLSHFDRESEYRDFRGFFVLFWIGLAFMVITTMLRNIRDTGHPMRIKIWTLFTKHTWQLALSDLALVATTGVSLPLHRLFRRSTGWLRWERGGMVLQSVYQMGWLALWIAWPFIFHWAWTAQVFLTLHTLTLLMKMHSYAFYNGHLSTTQRRLLALDHPATASTSLAYKYPGTGSSLDGELDEPTAEPHPEPADPIESLREELALELTSPLGRVTYPQNVSVRNYVDYLFCPTLCYELEYPRTDGVRWMELAGKILAVFGCIFLLTLISEEFILPVLTDSGLSLARAGSVSECGLIFAETISLLLFPFTFIMLLVFLVLFEYVLGAFAEITRFADRHFYSDWWNSTDWLEFSREWNIPVHNFFRRHVYGASRAYMSRTQATVVTFFLSALAHELIMACVTHKVRGYGFAAMMMQLPIVMVQKTPWLRGRKLFNNICFWCSIIFGLSLVSSYCPFVPFGWPEAG
ncbi:MAG: hypothetical protein M1826_000435 [Phylliscum demangeonii]|nr:MAG: hypothetical protein M1826_000435 [Phylliscum demangeonii]